MVEEKLLIDDMSMDELLAASPEKVNTGTVVNARVLSKSAEGVLVDIGQKMEGLIPKAEFPDFETAALPFKEGDSVPVLVRQQGGQDGYTKVSWRSAREMTAWDKLFAAFQSQTPVDGVIRRKVKGGYVVDIGMDAFLPGSQLDMRPIRDVDAWLNKTIQVAITEMDKHKSNVVVSRRKLIEQDRTKQCETTLATLAEGSTVEGRIASLQKFGAFVDIGGIEGLLHISEISWHRIDKIEEAGLKEGEAVQLKVIKYDTTTQPPRISLSRKQLLPRPWDSVPQRYPLQSIVKGRVTTLTNFGAFVQLEPGIEGLIHVSEFSWKDRNPRPQDFVKAQQTVDVKVILIDPSKEKISLSLKRAGESPWDLVKAAHPVGSRIKGPVTHLTSFGAFVMLPEGVEGLIHISDFSWTKKIKKPSDMVAEKQDVEAVVMDVKPEAERIVLSLKHLQQDPINTLRVGQSVTGKVTQVRDQDISVELSSGIDAYVRIKELSLDIQGHEKIPAVGEEITAKVVRTDKKDRRVELSVRRHDRDEERQMVAQYATQNQDPLTLGDVLLERDTTDTDGAAE